ncbi:MAG TPA: hypothetical protein VF600_17825 [Abditibacteriaceae bacterium]|jgi:hypothetical protein
MFPTFHTSSQKSFGLILAAAIAVNSLSPAHAVVQSDGAAVTVTPGGNVVPGGLRVAVVSATDTAGDVLTAQRALVAANMAVARTRGYITVPQAEVVRALSTQSKKGGLDNRGPNQQRGATDRNAPFGESAEGDTRLPVDSMDYKSLRKSANAQRALSVFVTREASDANGSTVSAVVELYDTKSGGLVGRGQSTFTSTVSAAETAAGDVAAPAPAPAATKADEEPIVNGRARTTATSAELAQVRALGGAIYRAVAELNRPAETRGVVISIPDPYRARISMGERSGLRNGARLEYLVNGEPVAYGTVTNAGLGESVATVAPESAFPNVFVNMEVRNISNPVSARTWQRSDKSDEKAFRRFENEFTAGLVVAGLLYVTGVFDKIHDIHD